MAFNVGIPGFEPGTPCSQNRCATGLRYIPKKLSFCSSSRTRTWDPSAALAFFQKLRGGMRYRAALHPEILSFSVLLQEQSNLGPFRRTCFFQKAA